MARTRRGLDRDIRRLRRTVFHPSDAIADRAHELLGRLLVQRRAMGYPTERADWTGHTSTDRAILARNGLSVADFM